MLKGSSVYYILEQVDRKSTAPVRKARESYLGVRGAILFNLLPDSLRTMNTEHVDMFKNHLDIFLSSILESHIAVSNFSVQ